MTDKFPVPSVPSSSPEQEAKAEKALREGTEEYEKILEQLESGDDDPKTKKLGSIKKK
jgi:hypothetical protein